MCDLVDVYLILQEIFSKVIAPFYIPTVNVACTTIYSHYSCSTSSETLGFRHLVNMTWYLIIFSFHFLEE